LTGPEALEGRVVLSQVGVPSGALAATKAVAAVVHTAAAPPVIGAVGDSLTDEYVAYPPDRSQARNWVELMAATHRANFGPFSTVGLGAPRNQGFVTNWAQSDATSSDLVANQLPGLAAQVHAGLIQYASVIVGDNDFGRFLQEAPALAANPPIVLALLGKVEATAEANFDTTVRTLLAANPNARVVAGTILDVTRAPAVQQEFAPFGAPAQLLLNVTSQSIARYNNHVRLVAGLSSRVALADLAAQQAALSLPTGVLPFGGTAIDLVHPGDEYHHFILADGTHPGTVAQGLVADAIIAALDAKFHAGITPLSPAEILFLAANATRIL
jgi:hypothetical protein